LYYLPTAFCVAQKMGKSMGRSKILLRFLPQQQKAGAGLGIGHFLLQ